MIWRHTVNQLGESIYISHMRRLAGRLSGNAFVSRVGSLWLKSQSGQIGHSNASGSSALPVDHQRCDIFPKGAV